MDYKNLTVEEVNKLLKNKKLPLHVLLTLVELKIVSTGMAKRVLGINGIRYDDMNETQKLIQENIDEYIKE